VPMIDPASVIWLAPRARCRKPHLSPVPRVHEDVVRLDVAVHDALRCASAARRGSDAHSRSRSRSARDPGETNSSFSERPSRYSIAI